MKNRHLLKGNKKKQGKKYDFQKKGEGKQNDSQPKYIPLNYIEMAERTDCT